MVSLFEIRHQKDNPTVDSLPPESFGNLTLPWKKLGTGGEKKKQIRREKYRSGDAHFRCVFEFLTGPHTHNCACKCGPIFF